MHRNLANPVMRRVAPYVPSLVILETTGRRSGSARQVPLTGVPEGSSVWLVSDHGRAANYVRNIEAEPRVRVQLRGRWRTGTAHLVPEDDPHARLREQPRANAMLVRLLGTDLMSVRIDLDGPSS